jgi:hypothetical protein
MLEMEVKYDGCMDKRVTESFGGMLVNIKLCLRPRKTNRCINKSRLFPTGFLAFSENNSIGLFLHGNKSLAIK